MRIIILAILGAFFNSCIRGGLIKIPYPKLLNALGFGLAVYYISKITSFSVLMTVGMYLGQMPAIFKNEIDEYYQNKQYLDWTLIVLERALVWVLPFILASMGFAHDKALWWLLAVPMMPLAYSVMFCGWLHTRVNRWALAEALFGSCLWVLLGVISG